MRRLFQPLDAEQYGGKAANLSALIRAHNNLILVPSGFALAWDQEFPESGEMTLWGETMEPTKWAVRSSAIGEDSEKESFAGQHETLLNVLTPDVRAAVTEVRRSLYADRVLAYRRRHGIVGEPRMGVVIQQMVKDVITSAVVFTKDPIDGSDNIIVETTGGLGDKLVGGQVTPNNLTLRRGERSHDPAVDRLVDSALACEAVIGGYADVEAAYNGRWWICQARRITT